eukprot:TRINITY_DN2425_c1_g3_i2.p1 TRINITY_DN2425_c1_g3~~TRINITY_DN2425_c1_g3_i2.p1  ORF type:complete len:316 (+),score=22.15 TRINITY_DN2425_c1_g3_i2:144-950(+)
MRTDSGGSQRGAKQTVDSLNSRDSENSYDQQYHKSTISQQQYQIQESDEQYREWQQYKEEFLNWRKQQKVQEVDQRSVLSSYQDILENERMVAMQWQQDFVQSETSFYNTLDTIRRQLQLIKEECEDETEGEIVRNLQNYPRNQSQKSRKTQGDAESRPVQLTPHQQFAQNTLKNLQSEFEHEAGMLNDDVDFIREVATGQEIAPEMNLTQELVQLKKRFESWKEHFKYKLRDARDIIVAQQSPPPQQQEKEADAVSKKKKGIFGVRR